MNRRLPPENRLLPIIGLGLFVLSVTVTLLLLLSGREEEPEAPKASTVYQAEELDFEDFLLPGSRLEEESRYYPLRERMDRWTDEQVKRFWIPPKDIALEIITEENDRRIREIFRDVP